MENGHLMSVEDLEADILRYRTYMKTSGGGVTISGGEPLYQPHFVAELLNACHRHGIHTALDTSGYCSLDLAKPVLEKVDLVLLDIKSWDPDTYHTVTSVELAPTLAMANYLAEIHKPTWIRFVLVPGLTDDPENVAGLAQFVATLSNVEKVEVLPFHKMGEYKWDQMGYPYRLRETLPPTSDQVERAKTAFRQVGVSIA
jgi:pyruvate formate lyase activating enzyme